MPLKYNLNLLKEKFSLTTAEIESFIDNGLLIPDGWNQLKPTVQDLIIKDGFVSQIWSAKEVERFDRIINQVKDKHLHFYHIVNTRLNEIDAGFQDSYEQIYKSINKLRYDFNKLRSRIERKEIMIDIEYFCQMTGMSKQTFYNTKVYLDNKKLVCRLKKTVYKDLIWYKIKGTWQTPLINFEEIRSGFTYELWLDEKKRRGEFIPALNASIEEIIKLDKNIGKSE